MFNALVHVFMYFYFALTVYMPPPWWKKFITTGQIIQFQSSFVLALPFFYIHIKEVYVEGSPGCEVLLRTPARTGPTAHPPNTRFEAAVCTPLNTGCGLRCTKHQMHVQGCRDRVGDSTCSAHAQGVLYSDVTQPPNAFPPGLFPHADQSEQGAGSVYLNAAFNLSLLALFISFKKRTYANAPIDTVTANAKKAKAS